MTDEYSKAFNADDEEMKEESMMDEVSDNKPDDGAAEGADEPAAVAVVLTDDEVPAEGMPTEPAMEASVEEPMSPEDEQRAKSWEGRLKKREAEIAAREAELEAKMAPLPEAATGGEVVDDTIDNTDMPAEVEPEVESPAEEGGDMIESLKSQATALMEDPAKLRASIESVVNDFGPEFVVAAMVMSSPMFAAVFDNMAKPYVEGMESKLSALTDDVIDAFRSNHTATIAEAHEDFEQIVDSPEFQAFIDGMEETEKAAAQQVIEAGSAGQIIKLLKTYKDSQKAPEQSPDDVWAEDAAAGVKGSAPVRLPTRAPASQEDEFKRAWETM